MNASKRYVLAAVAAGSLLATLPAFAQTNLDPALRNTGAGRLIAEQGNAALREIARETREAMQRLPAATLPAPKPQQRVAPANLAPVDDGREPRRIWL